MTRCTHYRNQDRFGADSHEPNLFLKTAKARLSEVSPGSLRRLQWVASRKAESPSAGARHNFMAIRVQFS